MSASNSVLEIGNKNGGGGRESEPDCGSSTFNIKITHGLNEHEVAVPSNSSFGELKSVIAEKIGLKPETHKLLFRGKQIEDDECLQTAGVKDNSKVLLMEEMRCSQKSPEEVKQLSVISRGGPAVAEVREEVDMLTEQVSALQAVVDSGTQVDDKGIVYLTEMLMRQLLKLDGIDAEGEGRVQRKMEVRRVQCLVETMDILKSRNLNPFSNVDNTVSETSQWETFEASSESMTTTSQMPSSTPTLVPSSSPTPDPSGALSATESPVLSIPSPIPTPLPSSTCTRNPSAAPTPMDFPVPSIPPSTPSPVLSSTPSAMQLSAPSMPSSTPAPLLSSNPIPTQFSAPSVPSSTKVTQDWEHFD